jgi:hypothetical protein
VVLTLTAPNVLQRLGRHRYVLRGVGHAGMSPVPCRMSVRNPPYARNPRFSLAQKSRIESRIASPGN